MRCASPGASRAAIDVYLGDMQDLARTAQVFRGWVGDRSAYAGFSYTNDLSWQAAPTKPATTTAAKATATASAKVVKTPEQIKEERKKAAQEKSKAAKDGVKAKVEAVKAENKTKIEAVKAELMEFAR